MEMPTPDSPTQEESPDEDYEPTAEDQEEAEVYNDNSSEVALNAINPYPYIYQNQNQFYEGQHFSGLPRQQRRNAVESYVDIVNPTEHATPAPVSMSPSVPISGTNMTRMNQSLQTTGIVSSVPVNVPTPTFNQANSSISNLTSSLFSGSLDSPSVSSAIASTPPNAVYPAFAATSTNLPPPYYGLRQQHAKENYVPPQSNQLMTYPTNIENSADVIVTPDISYHSNSGDLNKENFVYPQSIRNWLPNGYGTSREQAAYQGYPTHAQMEQHPDMIMDSEEEERGLDSDNSEDDTHSPEHTRDEFQQALHNYVTVQAKMNANLPEFYNMVHGILFERPAHSSYDDREMDAYACLVGLVNDMRDLMYHGVVKEAPDELHRILFPLPWVVAPTHYNNHGQQLEENQQPCNVDFEDPDAFHEFYRCLRYLMRYYLKVLDKCEPNFATTKAMLSNMDMIISCASTVFYHHYNSHSQSGTEYGEEPRLEWAMKLIGEFPKYNGLNTLKRRILEMLEELTTPNSSTYQNSFVLLSLSLALILRYMQNRRHHDTNVVWGDSMSIEFIQNIEQKIVKLDAVAFKKISHEHLGLIYDYCFDIKLMCSPMVPQQYPNEKQTAWHRERVISLLCISKKRLDSSYLQSRIRSLTFFKNMIAQATSMNQYPGYGAPIYRAPYHRQNSDKILRSTDLDAPTLSSWLKESGICAIIFGDKIHIETASRATSIVEFLATTNNLQDSDIRLIWQASQTQHETITRAIYNMLPDLAKSFTRHHFEVLFKDINEVNFETINEDLLSTITRLASKCFEEDMPTNPSDPNAPNSGWLGTTFLEKIMYSPDVSSVTNDLAMFRLIDLLSTKYSAENGKSNLRAALLQSFTNIRLQHHNSKICYVFILHLLEKIRTNHNETFKELMIEIYKEKESIVQTLMLDFVLSFADELTSSELSLCKELNIDNPEISERRVPMDKAIPELKVRLRLLHCLYSNSELCLDIAQIDRFWEALVGAKHPNKALTNQFFQWMTHILGQSELIDFGDTYPVLGEETIAHIVTKLICNMKVDNLTKDGFDMMNEYFVSLNLRNKNYVRQKRSLVVTNLDNILGIEKFQSVIFQCKNETVGAAAIVVLQHILQAYARNLKQAAYEKHIQIIIDQLKTPEELSSLTIMRCFSVLHMFLNDVTLFFYNFLQVHVLEFYTMSARIQTEIYHNRFALSNKIFDPHPYLHLFGSTLLQFFSWFILTRFHSATLPLVISVLHVLFVFM